MQKFLAGGLSASTLTVHPQPEPLSLMLYLTILFITNRRIFLNSVLQCCFFAHMPSMAAIAGRMMFKPISLFFKDLFNLLLLFSLISYNRTVSESLIDHIKHTFLVPTKSILLLIFTARQFHNENAQQLLSKLMN